MDADGGEVAELGGLNTVPGAQRYVRPETTYLTRGEQVTDAAYEKKESRFRHHTR